MPRSSFIRSKCIALCQKGRLRNWFLFQTDLFAGKWPANDTTLSKWYAGLDYLEHRLNNQEWLSGDKVDKLLKLVRKVPPTLFTPRQLLRLINILSSEM